MKGLLIAKRAFISLGDLMFKSVLLTTLVSILAFVSEQALACSAAQYISGPFVESNLERIFEGERGAYSLPTIVVVTGIRKSKKGDYIIAKVEDVLYGKVQVGDEIVIPSTASLPCQSFKFPTGIKVGATLVMTLVSGDKNSNSYMVDNSGEKSLNHYRTEVDIERSTLEVINGSKKMAKGFLFDLETSETISIADLTQELKKRAKIEVEQVHCSYEVEDEIQTALTQSVESMAGRESYSSYADTKSKMVRITNGRTQMDLNTNKIKVNGRNLKVEVIIDYDKKAGVGQSTVQAQDLQTGEWFKEVTQFSANSALVDEQSKSMIRENWGRGNFTAGGFFTYEGVNLNPIFADQDINFDARAYADLKMETVQGSRPNTTKEVETLKSMSVHLDYPSDQSQKLGQDVIFAQVDKSGIKLLNKDKIWIDPNGETPKMIRRSLNCTLLGKKISN
jgi:hypothetical protein